MGRYPTVNDEGEYLDPRNAFYKPLLNAIDDLKDAEDKWYKRRRDVFNEYDFGDFNESDGDVEKKYDQFCGDDPWNYKSRFDNIDPSRPSGGGYRLVQNQFPTSNISDGYATNIFVVNGEDDDGDPCGGDRYVAPENRKSDDGDCDDSPAPRVLRYQEGRGKGSVDCLYFNLAAFKDKGTKSSLRYYESTGDDDDPFEEVDVFTRFGEIPYAWNAKDGYGQQALSALKAAGDDYEDQVRPYLDDYKDALENYRTAGGGDLESFFDYLGGTLDRPWDGFDGDETSYNRPPKLPSKLIRQVRSIPKPGEA